MDDIVKIISKEYKSSQILDEIYSFKKTIYRSTNMNEFSNMDAF